jgi:hypothetical protein
VAVGAYFATKPKNKSISKSVVNQTDPNDPSTFQKDSRLHQSFYGFAYTPEGSQLPDCGNSLGELCCLSEALNLLMSKKPTRRTSHHGYSAFVTINNRKIRRTHPVRDFYSWDSLYSAYASTEPTVTNLLLLQVEHPCNQMFISNFSFPSLRLSDRQKSTCPCSSPTTPSRTTTMRHTIARSYLFRMPSRLTEQTTLPELPLVMSSC